MQIQRIQSLLLLIAVICMATFIFVPFGSWTEALADGSTAVVSLKAYDFIGMLIPAGVAVILLAVDIFMYKNFSQQKTVLLIAIMMILVTIGLVIYINCDHATQGTLHWGGSGLMALGALIASISAFCAIRSDERLLRSYNRLR